MTTQEQQDTWTMLCNEAAEVGMWLVHVPDDCLFTVPPPVNGQTVVYLRCNNPNTAIEEAKRSIAFKRMFPIPTNDQTELKSRLTAFDAQYSAE